MMIGCFCLGEKGLRMGWDRIVSRVIWNIYISIVVVIKGLVWRRYVYYGWIELDFL